MKSGAISLTMLNTLKARDCISCRALCALILELKHTLRTAEYELEVLGGAVKEARVELGIDKK